jgi:dimethylhistidine N-methyltransferase
LEKIMGRVEINTNTQSLLTNLLIVRDEELLEVFAGLQKNQKTLPSKLFYDLRGSLLFDQICKLDEYYLTRTETSILQENINEIAKLIGPNCVLIEFGSGSSTKTKLLLDNLDEIAAYVPVDISQDHLFDTAENLSHKYPKLSILPLWADFTKEFSLSIPENGFSRKVAFFPGSTIGNFFFEQAIDFMHNVAAVVGPGGGFLIGIDLQKDPEILNLAYNDHKGVTAAFNLNMLSHINQKFQSDFVESQFKHHAFYNQPAGRIEMHLASKQDQVVTIDGSIFDFSKGESILTEVSHKYSAESFASMAAEAGFEVHRAWVDSNNYFSIQYLVAK